MNKVISYESLNQFGIQLLEGHSSIALTTHDGLALKVKYQTLPEIGSLPVAAQTTQQYLKLEDGDIAITNDPYSGGTELSSMNLVMGICTQESRDTNLLIVKKIPMKPKVYLGQNIEEEGVRVPPMPIYSGIRLSLPVIDSIAEHPLAPANFKEAIVSSVEEMKALHQKFKRMDKVYDLDWSRSHLKSFLKDSQLMMQNFLKQIRSGDKIEELELNDGSKMKLRVDIADEKVIFDFSGSDISESVHLTHSAALGSCTGALLALFGKHLPVNNGIFQCIEVIAPEGTMVHAKYPSPVYFGMTDGAAMVANLAIKAIGNIDKEKRYSMSGSSFCSFDIEFKEGHFFETLESGAGAGPASKGIDGVTLWRRSSLEPSVEAIETRFPILVDSFSFRPNSGGGGKYVGGNGVVKSFTVLEGGKLSWSIFEPSEKPMGMSGGKDAQEAEIYLQRKGEKRSVLAKKGKLELQAGDRLVIQSSGGGGHGVDE